MRTCQNDLKMSHLRFNAFVKLVQGNIIDAVEKAGKRQRRLDERERLDVDMSSLMDVLSLKSDKTDLQKLQSEKADKSDTQNLMDTISLLNMQLQ